MKLLPPSPETEFDIKTKDCSSRALRVFREFSVKSMKELAGLTAEQVGLTRGCSVVTVNEVRRLLWDNGLMLQGDKVVAILFNGEYDHGFAGLSLCVVGDVER